MKPEDILTFMDILVSELFDRNAQGDRLTAHETLALRNKLERLPPEMFDKCLIPIQKMLEVKFEDQHFGPCVRQFHIARSGTMSIPIEPGEIVRIHKKS